MLTLRGADFCYRVGMQQADFQLKPVERLAVVYTPERLRAAFSLLLAIDSRLADVVLQASEPLIAQMKLAWWLDAVTGRSEGRPKGEPMLSELAVIESTGDAPHITHALVGVIEAWQWLAAQADRDSAAIGKFAALRGDAVFGSFADWVGAGSVPAREAGRIWGEADFYGRTGEAGTNVSPRKAKLPRPLSILLLAVTTKATGGTQGMRLTFHALTGW